MRRRQGVTLLELMLAFGFAAVAILGLVGVFVSGLKMSTRARNLAGATEVAREVMEVVKFRVREHGFAYLPAGNYRFDGSVPDSQMGTPPLEFPPAPYPALPLNQVEYFVVVSGSELSPTLKELRVESGWDGKVRVLLETRFHP